MIKLKDILFENSPPNLLIPRRIEGRVEKYVQALVQKYIKDGSKGSLNLSGLKLTKLPSNLKNVSVGESFNCNVNNLTSLAGAPSSVGGHFRCSSNKLTSLDGAPNSVGKDFYCSYNNLKSLVGAPSSVGKDFYCNGNAIKFTIEQVQAVCDVKGEIYI